MIKFLARYWANNFWAPKFVHVYAEELTLLEKIAFELTDNSDGVIISPLQDICAHLSTISDTLKKIEQHLQNNA